MTERQVVIKRPFFSQGRTAPLRIHRLHSQNDIPKKKHLSPIKLKTQTSKYIKSSSNHLPISQQLKMNVQQILKKGKYLFSQRKFDQVIPTLKPLLNTSKQIQSLYYIGCSFFYKSKYQHSIYYLNLVIQNFMILAAAYKELNLPKVSIKILVKCLEYNKSYEEAIVYLAKMYIKIRQCEKAMELLEMSLKKNSLGVLRLTYADCLRLVGRLEEALGEYNKLCEDQGLMLVGLMKRMTLYYELNQNQLSLDDCNTLLQHQVKSSQIHYFKGMNTLQLTPHPCQFPVDFYKSLDLNNHQLSVTRSLCEIIKYHINKKDIYSAELEIKRVQHLNIRFQEIKELKLFVEGAIDCVKKRAADAINKLTQVEKSLKFKSRVYSKILEENIDTYLGYAYFLSSQYHKAIKHYTLQKEPSVSSNYNKLICEGIIFNQNNDFAKTYTKINQAKTIIPHYEPYFYLGINYVQQHFSLSDPQLLSKAILQLQAGTEYNPTSLYYFYFTLVLMQAKKPAEAMISIAIQKSDDNVADYYFVRGIIEAENDLNLALNDFTSAIQMLKIPAYYKERSKCLYQLGMYSLAIEDLLKILSIENDYQSSILLAFNYYANEEYLLSLNTLNDITSETENQYLLGLKVALNIHLRHYKKAGTIGQVILSMQLGVKVFDTKILDKFQQIIEQKLTIGQFDTVEILCLGGTYYFINGDYQKSQMYFYDALNQLKQQLSQNLSTIDFGTQAKIYQSKFNISLTHLMLKEFEESKKLVDILIEETESEETVVELRKLQGFIAEEIDKQQKMSINAEQVLIDIFPNYKLLSQKFPVTKIRFKTAVLVFKPILFYPQKIRFNIFPELNPKFLREFGIWKIENTPEPPWVIRDGNSFKFTTNTLDGGQVVVEYTDSACEGERESSIERTGREENISRDEESTIRMEELKLPDKVNEKLQRMMKEEIQKGEREV